MSEMGWIDKIESILWLWMQTQYNAHAQAKAYVGKCIMITRKTQWHTVDKQYAAQSSFESIWCENIVRNICSFWGAKFRLLLFYLRAANLIILFDASTRIAQVLRQMDFSSIIMSQFLFSIDF